MKKAILALFVILILAIAGGVFYVVTNLDNIVKVAIEKYGSQTTKTDVKVDNVLIKLTEGSAAINGLTVGNPEGFSLPNAFSLGQIATDINIEKTNKELVAIDLINIEAPQVFYEINAERQGSLNVLKNNISTGGSTSASASDSNESQNAPIKLEIARFNLKNAKLHARIAPLNDKTYDLKLPPLQLTNLKGTPQQISQKILNSLIDHAKKEIKKQGLDKELDALKTKAKEQLDSEKAKMQEKAESRLNAEEEKVKDKLKGLLGN